MANKHEIFESEYESAHEFNGVWEEIIGKPDYQSAKNNFRYIRLERRLVDYFYQKLYEKKDSHRHWITVVKYGSKTIYLNADLKEFSSWFFSDSILLDGGHAWKYNNRRFEYTKYRNKPK